MNRSSRDKERRSSHRIQLNLSTSLMLVRIDAYHTGVITDLSTGGCYFPVEHGLPVGERCQVDIVFGDGFDVDTISVSGHVVRSDSHGAGIEFIDNPSEVTTRLGSILSRFSIKD